MYNMQQKDASLLRKNWGNKPCSHPEFAKEYMLGAGTGDYVCTQCGEIFSPDEYKEIKQKRKNI